jgi:8-oxo-dGTP diphosphatase
VSEPEGVKPLIIVTAAVIERGGRYLVARRLAGTHLEGLWEFPGGKCQPLETAEACLEREILEELGVRIRIGPMILKTLHGYQDQSIELQFFRAELEDEPRPILGQELQWVRREDLRSLELPPADDELVRLLVEESWKEIES